MFNLLYVGTRKPLATVLLHPIEARIRRDAIRKLEAFGSSSSKLLVSNKRDSIEQGLPTKPIA